MKEYEASANNQSLCRSQRLQRQLGLCSVIVGLSGLGLELTEVATSGLSMSDVICALGSVTAVALGSGVMRSQSVNEHE